MIYHIHYIIRWPGVHVNLSEYREVYQYKLYSNHEWCILFIKCIINWNFIGRIHSWNVASVSHRNQYQSTQGHSKHAHSNSVDHCIPKTFHYILCISRAEKDTDNSTIIVRSMHYELSSLLPQVYLFVNTNDYRVEIYTFLKLQWEFIEPCNNEPK